MELTFEQVVPAPRDEVFAFHARPENLAVLMGCAPGFRLLHHDGAVQPGRETWVEVTWAKCVPVALGFRHTIYQPPERFGEELVHGPFRAFSHVHEFEAHADGTLVRDRLHVTLPWTLGGEIAMRALAGGLRRVFAARQRALSSFCRAGRLAVPALAARA